MSFKKKKTVWGLIILKNIKGPGHAGFKIKLFLISNITREQRLSK